MFTGGNVKELFSLRDFHEKTTKSLLVIDKLFHTELYGEHNELDIIGSWFLKKIRETVKESKITNRP